MQTYHAYRTEDDKLVPAGRFVVDEAPDAPAKTVADNLADQLLAQRVAPGEYLLVPDAARIAIGVSQSALVREAGGYFFTRTVGGYDKQTTAEQVAFDRAVAAPAADDFVVLKQPLGPGDECPEVLHTPCDRLGPACCPF